MITLYIIAIALAVPLLCIGVMLVRRQIDLLRRGWTITGAGRDQIAYVERYKGRLVFDAELLVGPVRRIIQIPTATWSAHFPGWAKDRREEIVKRIKEKLPEPKYEYREMY